jgi:hypothetical protein
MSDAGKSRTIFQSSELSRASAEIFAAAADHPVHITGRVGESFMLMSESADRAREALLELADQLVAISTSKGGPLSDHVRDRFPWMLALSPDDQDACAAAILAAARASFATRQPQLAIAELTSWRETATAIADGLGKKPIEWLDEAESGGSP